MARRHLWSVFLAAMTVGGCNLDWQKPDISVATPSRFREAAAKSGPAVAGARDFAAQFHSRELVAVTAEALSNNLDLAAAVARIAEADAQARISSAALWPTLAMANTASRARGLGPTLNITRTSLALLGGGAGYEIDFWHKNEDASSAARLLADASRFDRDVVEIATTAAVMNAYFTVLAAQDRVRVANENVKIAETVDAAIKARLAAGTATSFDLAQQDAVLATQRAQLPPLEQTLRQTKNTLAVLLGRAPEYSEIAGGSLAMLRTPTVAPGLPSEVLLRRPDVAEVETKLASQDFSVLQARAAFFPSITLTGQVGLESIALNNFMRPDAVLWQVAANMAQPLFDGYNLQGQYELQKGKYAELAALYRKQILTALADTENALIALRETGRQLKLQGEAVAATKRAYEAAEARMREGTIDIVTLSTTETAYFQNQDLLVRARLAHFLAYVGLFQALGGGWSQTTREAEIASANEAYEANKGPWP